LNELKTCGYNATYGEQMECDQDGCKEKHPGYRIEIVY